MNRRSMTDLLLLVGLLAGATMALLVPGVPWPVEWAFGLPLLLLCPGYALVAALAPEAPSARPETKRSLDWAARAGLTLVLSAVVVAVVGVLLGTLGLLRLTPVVGVVGGVSLAGAGVAAHRRRSIPVDRRGDPLVGVSPPTLSDRVDTSAPQTVLLIVAVVALAGALAFAGGTATAGDSYSEVYLSSGDDDVGSLGNGTMTFAAGGTTPVNLTLANHEGETVTYGVVVRLERVDDGTVVDQQRLDRFDVRLDDGETRVAERRLSPSMTGERLRLRILVYTEDAPADAGADRAALVLRHWVTVAEEGSA